MTDSTRESMFSDSVHAEMRLREELNDLHLRFADAFCTCGHAFSNHRKLSGGDEPWIAWRCDESDGCRDFTLAAPIEAEERVK